MRQALVGLFSYVVLGSAVAGLAGCVSVKNAERAAAQTELAAAYYREGNPEAAIEALRRAEDQDPRNWRAANLLAVAYLSKGLPEQAEAEFKRALRIKPDEAEILVNYGAMKLRRGDNAAAIALFTRAMGDLEYRNVALVLSNLSLAYFENGEYAKAVDSAREATRRAPTLCQGWFHLGLAEEKLGHSDNAVAAYDGLKANCPSDSQGADVRVACLQAKGDAPELGRDALRQLVEKMRGTPLGDQARACLTGS
jgi:Tfp pilus assembly protein PilF